MPDRSEEMVLAEQVGDAPLAAGLDRLAAGPAQVAHDGDRVAKGGQGAFDGRAQFRLVRQADPDRMQGPAGPAVEAAEGAALALVTGGVDVQGIAVGHAGALGPGSLPVQRLQGRQEAIAERGDGTKRIRTTMLDLQ